MTVYWTIAIITVLLNFFPVKTDKEYSIRLFISLIPLFLYGAFRVDFGLDYRGYEVFFEETHRYIGQPDERMEIGYYYLNRLLPSFRSLLILQTLLLCVAYFFLFKNYIPSKYAWLGFTLLFLNGPLTVFFMLSGIRNGITISLLILSTYFIQKRKFIHFIVIVLLASLFHASAILIAPIVYFVASGKPLNKRGMIIWIVVMVCFFLFSNTVILNYVDLFINTYFDRYSTYVDAAEEQGKGAGLLISIFSFVTTFIVFTILKDKQLTAKENMVIKLMLVFLLSFLLGPLNVRVSQYFAAFFIAGIVVVIRYSRNDLLKYGFITLVLGYSLYSLKLWFENPYFAYDIYQSVLFN